MSTMRHPIYALMLAGLAAFSMSPVRAQTAPGPGAAPATTPAVEPASNKPGGRPDRAIERIRTEDAGSRIDELRVGGETQSITVQPKANVPAYEVQPSDGARGAAKPSDAGNTGTTGSRFWNIFKF